MYSLRKHHEGFTLTNYGTSPTSSSREGIKSIVAMLNTDMTDGTYVKNTGDAYLPKASQSSMVPKDTGASISSNPLKSTPQPTDVAATMESLANFQLLATAKADYTTSLNNFDKEEVIRLRTMYPQFQNELLSAAADPDTTKLSVNDLDIFRDYIEQMSNLLRQSQMMGGVDYSGNNNLSNAVTTVAQPSNTLNLNDLQHLRERTNNESLKLTNLRSSSPTIIQRKNQLDAVTSDIDDMIVRIQNGKLNPVDIPITQDIAQAFLAAVSNIGLQLPSLVPPTGMTNDFSEGFAMRRYSQRNRGAARGCSTNSSRWGTVGSEAVDTAAVGSTAVGSTAVDGTKVVGGAVPGGVARDGAVRGNIARGGAVYRRGAQNGVDTSHLMNKAQHIKWNLDMKLSYDPKLAQKGRMLDRLEEIDKTLVNMAISETPASPELGTVLGKEINAIHVALGVQGPRDSQPPIDYPTTHYSRFDTEPTPSVYGMPDANEQRFSDSIPETVSLNTPSTNGRVAMVGPYPVGPDGRIQYNKSNNISNQTRSRMVESEGRAQYNKSNNISDQSSARISSPLNTTKGCHIAIPITPGSFMKYNISDQSSATMSSPLNTTKSCHTAIPITPGSFMTYGSAIPSNNGVGTQGMYIPVNKAAYHVNHRGANSAGGQPAGVHMGTHHTAGAYHKNRKVEGFKCMSMPNAPQRQYDSAIRPGFQMDDASLEQRASASAFDPSTVGGPNWKKRAQDLCEQVGSAGLAPPGNFGCIEDETTVSKDYSWKGNYEMVCNRLGDTWGGWYPEMMGCKPPTNKFQSH